MARLAGMREEAHRRASDGAGPLTLAELSRQSGVPYTTVRSWAACSAARVIIPRWSRSLRVRATTPACLGSRARSAPRLMAGSGPIARAQATTARSMPPGSWLARGRCELTRRAVSPGPRHLTGGGGRAVDRIAGVIRGVADLGAAASGPGSGSDLELHGGQAAGRGNIPGPLAAEFLSRPWRPRREKAGRCHRSRTRACHGQLRPT